MYICPNCNQIVDELPTGRTSYPEPFGNGERSEIETITDCSCGGQFEEAAECKICGEVCANETLHDGFCPECLPDAYDDMKSSQNLSQLFIQHQKEEIEQLKQELAKTKQPFSIWAAKQLENQMFGGNK